MQQISEKHMIDRPQIHYIPRVYVKIVINFINPRILLHTPNKCLRLKIKKAVPS